MPYPQYTVSRLPDPVALPLSDKLLRLAASPEPHPYRADVAKDMQATLELARIKTQQTVASRSLVAALESQFGRAGSTRNRQAENIADILTNNAGPDGMRWALARQRALASLCKLDYYGYTQYLRQASDQLRGLFGQFGATSGIGRLPTVVNHTGPQIRLPGTTLAGAKVLDVLLHPVNIVHAPMLAGQSTLGGYSSIATLPLFAALEIGWMAGTVARPADNTNAAVRQAVANFLNPGALHRAGVQVRNSAWDNLFTTPEQCAAWVNEDTVPWPKAMPSPNPQYEYAVWPTQTPRPDTPRPDPRNTAETATTTAPINLGLRCAEIPASRLGLRRSSVLADMATRILKYSWLNLDRWEIDAPVARTIGGETVPPGTKIVVIDDGALQRYLWQSWPLFSTLFTYMMGMPFRLDDLQHIVRSDCTSTLDYLHSNADMLFGTLLGQRTISRPQGTRNVYFLGQPLHQLAPITSPGVYGAHVEELTGA